MTRIGLIGFLLLLSIVSGGTPVQAQAGFQVTNSFTFSLPSSQSIGSIARGNLVNDRMTDLAILLDGTPHLLPSPGLYGQSIPLSSSANDLTVLPADTASEDEILTVGSSGLTAWRYTNDNFVSRSVGSASWLNASLVAVANLNAGPGMEIFGVLASGNQVGIVWNPYGTPSESSFSVPFQIESIHAVDFDGNGACDLVLQTSGALFVYGTDGTVLYGWAGTGIDVAVLELSPGVERVAWLVAGPQQPLLAILDSTSVLQLLALDGLAVGVDAGDVDEDGDDDLIVHRTLPSGQLLLFNAEGVSPFSQGNAQYVPNSGTSGTLLDLDQDGDLDLVSLDAAGDSLTEFFNSSINAASMEPTHVLVNCTYLPAPNHDDADLAITVGPAPSVPAGATHVELVLWEQASPGGTTGPKAIDGLLSSNLTSNVTLTFSLENLGQEENKLYYWIQRYATLDSGGEYVAVFPAEMSGFTSQIDPTQPAYQYLASLSSYQLISVEEVELLGQVDPGNTGSLGGPGGLPELPGSGGSGSTKGG